MTKLNQDAEPSAIAPVRVQPVVRPQTTTRTTFVVQYKSIYTPREWIDHHGQETYFRQVDSENWAAGIRLVNPNVRVIKRTVTEDEVA